MSTSDQVAQVQCYDDRSAAKALDCSPSHIRALRKRGALPFVRIGRRVAIRHRDLLEFLEKHATRKPAA